VNPTALVPIAPDCEELEAVSIIDILRRAEVQVTVASVPSPGGTESLEITASRGVKLVADELLSACAGRTYDAIVLPGGLPGAEHLRDSALLGEMLWEQDRNQRIVAAICASPAVVLQHHDLIRDRRATCYPGLMDQLPASSRSAEKVVSMGNLITSRGPGTAMAFSLALVEALCGQDKREEIASQLLAP
jgi:4-methyl-5(b-hydroxyethyl)-thiazole monophosphate biosynthesis